ncbi:MAG: DHH family phosphoesterase [Candidatus Caldarchaeum sp.]|uniref:DHH family phosphoesterase n=1 Tax=Caldiarchaeum subterraneum TaxID=311458 RepID=A0A7J3VRZ3_CALS0
MTGDFQGFLKAAEEAAEKIRKWLSSGEFIDVYTHNDADALSSAGVVAGSLRREDARYRVRSLNRIEEFIVLLREGFVDSRTIIFTDIGSGYLDELTQLLQGREVVIVDHHMPTQAILPADWVQVNPHDHGFDGASELSASGVSYFVCKKLNPANVEYSAVAVVGALGDLQDKNSRRRLHGLNRMVVEDAVKAGMLEAKEDLILYGRTFRPLHMALASTTSPYIPGLSGREDACYSFLTKLGIGLKEGDQWRTLSDLTDEEKKTLYNGLLEYLVAKNIPTSLAEELVGESYDLVREESWTYLRDAREYATLLNSCGKTGRAWLGIVVAMGARAEVLEDAQRVLEEYRASLARAMDYAARPGVMEELNHIVVLKGGDMIDDKQVSSVASIISSSGLLPAGKALVAFATAGHMVKISSRASKQLVGRGVNLGELLHRLAEAYGGRGGGHDVAAGAEIPSDRIIRFLADLDRAVGEQLEKTVDKISS